MVLVEEALKIEAKGIPNHVRNIMTLIIDEAIIEAYVYLVVEEED